MNEYEIWLAYQKINLKIGLIFALIMSPFLIWYAYDTYKRINELKKIKKRLDKPNKK